MAVLTPKNLYRGALAASSATLYTAPSASGSYTIVKEILLCNTTAAVRDVTVYTVESGGSIGDNRKILSTVPIEPYSTVIFEMSTVLGQSETLRALASAATSVTATVSGVEFAA